MKGIIYLIDGGKLIDMTEQPYDSENLLQSLLAQYPDLLAGDQIDTATPRKWLLIMREAPLPTDEDGAWRWNWPSRCAFGGTKGRWMDRSSR